MISVRKITEFRYVVFDFDGTLVDSMGFYKKVFTQLTTRFGIASAEASEFYTSTAGTPLEEQFKMLFKLKRVAYNEEKIAVLCSELFRKCKEHKTRFFPGAKRLLRELSRLGIVIMISSGNTDSIIAKRLSDGGVTSCVAIFCGSTNIPKSPAHISHFAKKLCVRIEDLGTNGCYCGDGGTDMKIAVATGLYPIGVSTTVRAELLIASGAARVVLNIADLLEDFDRPR